MLKLFKQSTDFSFNLSAGYMVTPVAGKTWVTESFIQMVRSSDRLYEWVTELFTQNICLKTIIQSEMKQMTVFLGESLNH